jgi:hypothetical protein
MWAAVTTYRVHEPGVARAESLIDARHYDLETPWSEAAPSTGEANDQIERHGYDGYGEWHLAVDTGASEDTKDRYGFPFGDFSRVNRAALIHCEQRASQNGHDAVATAARRLLDRLDRTSA